MNFLMKLVVVIVLGPIVLQVGLFVIVLGAYIVADVFAWLASVLPAWAI